MNADLCQPGALIHRVDALDLPHVDQVSHIPAYNDFEFMPNGHGGPKSSPKATRSEAWGAHAPSRVVVGALAGHLLLML
jgi:hypothetical protein